MLKKIIRMMKVRIDVSNPETSMFKLYTKLIPTLIVQIPIIALIIYFSPINTYY